MEKFELVNVKSTRDKKMENLDNYYDEKTKELMELRQELYRGEKMTDNYMIVGKFLNHLITRYGEVRVKKLLAFHIAAGSTVDSDINKSASQMIKDGQITDFDFTDPEDSIERFMRNLIKQNNEELESDK